MPYWLLNLVRSPIGVGVIVGAVVLGGASIKNYFDKAKIRQEYERTIEIIKENEESKQVIQQKTTREVQDGIEAVNDGRFDDFVNSANEWVRGQ